MNTLDSLLLQIVNYSTPPVEVLISKRDSQVLKSFASSISTGNFLTQNQGNLLIKILRENAEKITIFKDDISALVESPIWSKPFRQVEHVRKLYIKRIDDSELAIAIEFTFASEIRKFVQSLSNTIENLSIGTTTKNWTCDLSERNIVTLVDALTPLNFEIDDAIKNYYSTIKSWSETEIKDQFLITSITHPNFEKQITADLGIDTLIDKNVILDRSVRYQYFTKDPVEPSEKLTEKIAQRQKTKLFVDNAQHSLTEVIASLIELKRLPVMVVFDTGSEDNALKNLKILTDSLEENRIFESVGVYFRLPNSEVGKKFNQLIAEKSYNARLDETTKIVGIQGGKIPKFFLKTPWKPMSIIGINTKMGLRHGKISVYSNCCDCIIEWDAEPALFNIDKRVGL